MSLARLLSVAAVLSLLAPAARAEPPAVKRTIVQKHDLRLPGQEGVVALVELPPGAREGRHLHPAEVLGYVIEGQFTMEVEGSPPLQVGPGGAFYVPAGKIHEGSNAGTATVRVVAVFVADKGPPLTSKAP